MTPKQIQYVRGLLRKAGLEDEKESLVQQYTNERTTHLSEMDYQETQELIKSLGGGQVTPRERMSKKILSMAHEMGWEIPGARKVDMSRVNEWCKKYSPQKCELKEVKEKDLPGLVTAFEKMYKGFLNDF